MLEAYLSELQHLWTDSAPTNCDPIFGFSSNWTIFLLGLSGLPGANFLDSIDPFYALQTNLSTFFRHLKIFKPIIDVIRKIIIQKVKNNLNLLYHLHDMSIYVRIRLFNSDNKLEKIKKKNKKKRTKILSGTRVIIQLVWRSEKGI